MATKKELLKIIFKHCDECCGDSHPRTCTCDICDLFPFRTGKDTTRQKKELTEEERKALRERFAKNSPEI